MKRLGLCILLAAGLSSCADEVNNASDWMVSCAGSSGTYYCMKGQLCCDDRCVDPGIYNCGGCGIECKKYETCQPIYNGNYACVCDYDLGLCSGTCCANGCTDLTTDSSNCGACGNACGENRACSLTGCVDRCPSTLSSCRDAQGNVTCVDIYNDPKNCGACGFSCPNYNNPELHLESSYCSAGVCQIVCRVGYDNADNNKDNGCEQSVSQCQNHILEPGEVCDGDNFGGKTCADFVGAGATGTPQCNDTCTGIISTSCKVPDANPTLCGNDRLDEGEVCDGTLFPANNDTCTKVLNVPSATGTLSCSSDCRTLDTSQCIFCGDGIVNGDEECDGTQLRVKTCAEYSSKYGSGNLSCAVQMCRYKLDECTSACKENVKQCATQSSPHSIVQCKSGEFSEVQKCTLTAPFCDPDTLSCVECLTTADCSSKGTNATCDVTTHTCKLPSVVSQYDAQGFEWLSKVSGTPDTSYTKVYKMSDYVSDWKFTLIATGRRDLNGLNIVINGEGIVLYTDQKPSSNITVSDLTSGLGKMTFKAKNYEKDTSASVTIAVDGGTVLDKKKISGLTDVSVDINNATAKTFVITSVGRVAIDDLAWTSK